MVVQLFVRKSDRECQKAERWLKERRLDFARIDVEVKSPSLSELESVVRSLQGDWDALLDTTGTAWRKGGFAWKVFDPRTELLEHPELLKLPILRASKQALVGFDADKYENFFLDL
jgi:Spx/MgsR family transcriptional regulator